MILPHGLSTMCWVQALTHIGQLDILLEVSRQEARLQGTLYYNTDLFDRTTAQRMLGHFMVGSPHTGAMRRSCPWELAR